MKKYFKKLFLLCLVALAISGSIQPVFANPAGNESEKVMSPQQQKKGRTVTGTITDAVDGSPLIGVNITLKGTTTGVISDIDGNYSIHVDNSRAVLVISYIGYKTREVPVEDLLCNPGIAGRDGQAHVYHLEGRYEDIGRSRYRRFGYTEKSQCNRCHYFRKRSCPENAEFFSDQFLGRANGRCCS